MSLAQFPTILIRSAPSRAPWLGLIKKFHPKKFCFRNSVIINFFRIRLFLKWIISFRRSKPLGAEPPDVGSGVGGREAGEFLKTDKIYLRKIQNIHYLAYFSKV